MDNYPAGEPSPEEIRERCLEINATWDAREENMHRADDHCRERPYETPTVRAEPPGGRIIQ